MAKLNINGKTRDVQAEPDTPLLWVIREQVGLTGTKFGCGVAQCGGGNGVTEESSSADGQLLSPIIHQQLVSG